jgi:hypothetical protein
VQTAMWVLTVMQAQVAEPATQARQVLTEIQVQQVIREPAVVQVAPAEQAPLVM